MECCNFVNNELKPDSYLLFATEKKVKCHKLMEDKETVDIQIKFQTSGLLGYFKSLNMWVVCFGTKYKTKNKAILAYNANPVILILKF